MNRKGQFLVGAVVFLAVLLIIIQAMVYFSKVETGSTVKETKSSTAFYLAETGVNHAIFDLQSSPDAFSNALANGPSAGYLNDVVYTDVPGGTYEILESTNASSQLTIIGTGKDGMAKEYRAIKVVLQGSSTTVTITTAAMYSAAISLPAGLEVFWGPIYATGNLNLAGNNDQLFPRKFSTGNISGPAYTRDSNGATPPNTDTIEWWTYQSAAVVPAAPTVDLNYYLNQAQSQGHLATGATTYTNYTDASGTSVYYFENAATFTGTTFIAGTIISLGSYVNFSGTGSGAYAVTPPAQAYLEYQKNTPNRGSCVGGGGLGVADDGNNNSVPANYSNNVFAEKDKACFDQYPGDSGLNVVESYNFSTGCASHHSGGGATLTPVTLHGFLYVANMLEGNTVTPVTIHGSVQLASGASIPSGKFQVFYDPSTQPQVTAGSGGFSQLSWKEVVATPF